MPYNSETEKFFQAPATVVDSTPDGDTVQEGFDDRLTPAMAGLYADLNLLKADGMISVGIPATTTSRGIGRVATSADLVDGATISNGPAFLAAGSKAVTTTPTPYAVPQADAGGKLDGWVSLANKANTDLSNVDLTKANVVLQQVRYQTGAFASGSTTIPWDATIPQNTEGDQYMSLSITPKSASSRLVIDVVANYSVSNNSVQTVGALFRDSIPSALAANLVYCPASTGTTNTKLTHVMESPGTQKTTFNFRIGAASGGINFNIGANFLGGVLASSMVITEYAV